MKLNLLNLPNIAITFYLIINANNILELLSLKEPWANSMVIAIIVTYLIGGYVLTARIQESWKVEQILKTEAAQAAIIAVAQSQGYDEQQAYKTVEALCLNVTKEEAEELLRAIALNILN